MRCRRYLQLVFLLLGMLVLSACGGKGGTKSGTSSSSVTVTGVVSFPASEDRVGKRLARTETDNTVTVAAYTLDGNIVPGTSVHPTYDPDATNRIYSYSIPGLKPGQDYVIKATKGTQVLKKLISKDETTGTSLSGQTIDAVSTAAVILASQKLSSNGATVVLGETLPSGKTVSELSSAIASTIKPALLEQTIETAISTPTANITTAETANYVNLFNIVVTAVVQNSDPAAIVAGTGTLGAPVPLFAVSGGTVTPPSTNSSDWTIPSASQVSAIATATAQAYTPPTETASTYTTLAMNYLAAQDISNASLNFERALTLDPEDKLANFGGAITSGVMLIENADVVAIVNRWGVVLPTVQQVVQGSSPVPVNFSNMTSINISGTLLAKSTARGTVSTNKVQSALAAFKTLKGKLPQQKKGYKSVAKELGLVPTTAPTVSEMQSVIDNVIIPRIDTMLARLAKVEGTGYTFTVTKAMQGNPVYGNDVVLNDCEFYTLGAALNLFQTLFEIVTSYNFDIPSQYNYNTVQQDPLSILTNPTFFTLKSNGAAKMNTALTYARSVATKASAAYNALLVRTPGTGAFDLSGWSASDKSSFSQGLAKVTAALGGETSIDLGGRTLTIDATKFFTNPLNRTKLPVFGYDLTRDAALSATYNKAVAGTRTYSSQVWNGTGYTTQSYTSYVECSLVPKSDLPDYTLNGILPGNTAGNNVMGFNAILPVADGKLITGTTTDNSNYNSYTTDGTYAYTVATTNTFTSFSRYIKKVDLATGAASVYANLSPTWNSGSLLYFNGVFYEPTGSYNSANNTYTISLTQAYPTNGQTGTAPVLTTYAAGYLGGMTHVSGLTSSGNDVYYVVSSYDPLAYIYRSDFYRLTGLGTQSPYSAFLFSKTQESDGYGTIAVAGGAIYADAHDFGLVKMDMTGNEQAAYNIGSISWKILVGNNFYGIDEERVIKYASIPGTTAKSLLSRFF